MELKRDVQMIRADTGVSRAHEFNAQKIMDAIFKIETDHWGYIGYSQGTRIPRIIGMTQQDSTKPTRFCTNGVDFWSYFDY